MTTRITREILRGRLSGEWWCFGVGVLRIKPSVGNGVGDCGAGDGSLLLQKYPQILAASVALGDSSIIFRWKLCAAMRERTKWWRCCRMKMRRRCSFGSMNLHEKLVAILQTFKGLDSISVSIYKQFTCKTDLPIVSR